MNVFEKLQGLLSSEEEEFLWTEFYEKLESEGHIDNEYLAKTAEKDISQEIQRIDKLTLAEVNAWLTWILRGERFCDGLFQSCIDNGAVSALLSRGNELLKDAEE